MCRCKSCKGALGQEKNISKWEKWNMCVLGASFGQGRKQGTKDSF